MMNAIGEKKFKEVEQRNETLQRLYKERRETCYKRDIENGIDPTFTFIDEDEDED